MLCRILNLYFRNIITAFILTFSMGLSAQVTPLEPRTSIDEVWRKDMNIPVSGEIRTGLVYDISPDEYVQEYFYVNLPEHLSDVLFVEITSNDGRYNANLSFDIKNQPAGPLKLKWSTQFYNDLKKFSYKELTILAWLEHPENSEDKKYVVSNWSAFDTQEFIYVILNSEQQSFINIFDPTTNQSENIKCEQFTNQAKVSFCAYCKIPKKLIKKDSEISVVQRARKSFNRYPMNLKL